MMASTNDNYNMASSLRIDADYANASMAHFMSSSPDSMSSPFSSTSDAAMHSLASSSSLSSASSSGGEPATPPPSMIKSAPATSSLSMDLKHKPHKCDVCGSSFARKVHLQRHSLRHQVCKPYCCELCGKCFSRQDSLVRHHRLLHDGVTTSVTSGSLSMADDKKSPKKTPAAKRASTGSILTVRASTACLRCSSAGTACDGQQPCARCTLNQGAESCCYASPSSSPSKRARRRHDSVATSSSSISMLAEEDEDWSAAHGVRRDTASSVASSSSTISELMSPVTSSYSLEDGNMAWNAAQTMIVHPHPFELPLQDSLLMAGFGGQHGDVKSLHPQQLQHDGGIALPFDVSLMSMLPSESQQTAPFSQTVMPLFDWSSLMNGHAEQQQLQQQLQLQAQQLSLLQQHVQAQANMAAAAAAAAAAKQPFSGAASNKSLNATLLGGQESGYSSPSMYGMQNAHLLAAAAAAYPPSNLSLNLTQAATDNWDGFMRQLSSPYHSAAAAAVANSMVA